MNQDSPPRWIEATVRTRIAVPRYVRGDRAYPEYWPKTILSKRHKPKVQEKNAFDLFYHFFFWCWLFSIAYFPLCTIYTDSIMNKVYRLAEFSSPLNFTKKVVLDCMQLRRFYDDNLAFVLITTVSSSGMVANWRRVSRRRWAGSRESWASWQADCWSARTRRSSGSSWNATALPTERPWPRSMRSSCCSTRVRLTLFHQYPA